MMNTATVDYIPPGVHIEAIPMGRLREAIRCAFRVLLDSNRTMDIVRGEEIVAQAQLRHLIEVGVFEGPEGAALLRERPDLSSVDLDALSRLPEDTLGFAFSRFLSENGLSTDLYHAPVEFTPDDERSYLLRRIRHSHDIWHVLTGFGIEGHDEILLHAFSLAQTGLPASVALMILGSLKHMLLEGRWGALGWGLREAYERGRRAAPLIPVHWERYWEEPLEALRLRHGIEAWTAEDHATCARAAFPRS